MNQLTMLQKRTLSDANITDFIIVEYKDEIGGRVHHESFGRGPDGEPLLVEYGANWVQGLGKENGPGMSFELQSAILDDLLMMYRKPHLDISKTSSRTRHHKEK
jgi:hypothetical protein